MKITAKTNEDVSYRGEPIRKMERTLDRAMKKAGFSFVRTTKMGDHQFKKDGKTYSYHIHGQSGDPQYFDYVTVTKGEVGWDKDIERKSFDDIDGAVAWLSTKTSEKRIAKKYGAKNEGPGAGYFIKLKNVNVDKVWVDSARQYSILKAKFSADWEANHSYWGGEGSADDFEVAIYLDRSLDEFMEWPGAEEEYAQKGSLFDFVKDTCLDDIKNMLNFDCGREGYTYGGGWTTKIPSDGVFEFDNMQFDPDACTVYQYHDKSYVPVSITSEDMMYGIQDAWDEWNEPENPEDESKQSEASEQMAINAYANKRFYDPEEFVKYVRKVAGKNGSYLSVDSVVSVGILDKANRLVQKDWFTKSEDASSVDDLLARHNQKWLVKVSYDVDASHSAVAPSIVRADTKDAATNIALKRHRGLGYNMKVVSVEPMTESHKKSEGIASDIRAEKPAVYLVSEAGNDYDYDELLDAFEGEQSYVSVETADKSVELPLAFDRDKNLLLILDDELSGKDAAYAKELVQGFVDGKTSVSSKPLTNDYVCIVDGMDYTATCYVPESKQTEEAGSFKVGDFVNYNAESDGDKLSTGWAFAEVVAVNEDGTLKLQPYNLEDYDEVDGVNPQFCEKMEHFAGMTDANTYYMDGKYNVYTGYYEIYVTTKELGKPYGFAGTLDSLDDVEQLMDYYDETMVYDQDIQDEVMSAVYGLTHYDEEDLKGINFADLSDKTESKKSEGLPPKKLGDRRYRSRADLINKMKQLGATEITTCDQYDELRNKQWLHKGGYAMDINGNLVGQTYFGDKDGKWYYASSKTFQGDYLPESKQNEKAPYAVWKVKFDSKADAEKEADELHSIYKSIQPYVSGDSIFVKDSARTGEIVRRRYASLAKLLSMDDIDYKRIFKGGKTESKKSEGTDEEAFGKFEDAVKSILMDKYGVVDSHGPSNETANSLVLQYGATLRDAFDKGGENGYDPTSVALLIITRQLREAPQFFDDCKDFTFNKDSKNSESKKSESLTLKQAELKKMAKYGEAEDITSLSDAEAKELKKSGVELVGISRGIYGMNGALMRGTTDGKLYVITSRNSNLFYFV